MKIIDKIKKHFASVYCIECEHCFGEKNGPIFCAKKMLKPQRKNYLRRGAILFKKEYMLCTTVRRLNSYNRYCYLFREKNENNR